VKRDGKPPLAGARGSLSGDSDQPLARPLPSRRAKSQFIKPPLNLFTTTLWEYPSQHYGDFIQGDKNYVGATPSWVIWQCLMRYTRENDLVVDPMCGSGTTIDVCKDLKRRALGYDLASFAKRPDILRADARKLPVEDAKADFVFIDPPYSTHVEYSDDPRCIGKLDALASRGTGLQPLNDYYSAMRQVIAETHRILKPKRHMALYVSDSDRKAEGFAPIGFKLFAIMREKFEPVDIVAVVRHNAKLDKGNWRKAADEGGFMMRGFNYLFIMKKS
jgi:DNA modification methylase